jgi:hypothetical protein
MSGAEAETSVRSIAAREMTEAEAEVEAARIQARERQYATYVEWAERLIERRAEANRFYISLNLAIVGAMGFLLTNPGGGVPSPVLAGWAMTAIAVAGIAVSMNWNTVITSQRRVATSKFIIIHELEKEMPATPYSDEWTKFAPHRGAKVSISAAERRLPLMFLVFYLVALIVILPALIVTAADSASGCGFDPHCLSGQVLGLRDR